MCRAIFETVTIIARFNDMTMVGQSIKQRGGHFGVAKHRIRIRFCSNELLAIFPILPERVY